jgi:hypothetical protein
MGAMGIGTKIHCPDEDKWQFSKQESQAVLSLQLVSGVREVQLKTGSAWLAGSNLHE